MPRISNATTAVQALAEGAINLVSYLFSALKNLAQRLGYLSTVFPSLPNSELDSLLSVLDISHQAGVTLDTTGQFPPISSLPNNPAIPGLNTIKVDAVIEVPSVTNPSGKQSKLVSVFLDGTKSGDELVQDLNDELDRMAQSVDWTDSTGQEGPGIDETGPVQRETWILGITRN